MDKAISDEYPLRLNGPVFILVERVIRIKCLTHVKLLTDKHIDRVKVK